MRPIDRRVGYPRHLGVYEPMPSYDTREDWLRRAADLRVHILACCGLWPMPDRNPLNPVIFGRIERDDYVVEKAYLESYPGFYVTGNLYRPSGKPVPCPAVLCPHGHWGRGRLQNDEAASIPGRCITFARQGYVAFSYDMIGYNDSTQLDHRFGGEREALWGISLMGLQLWNSIRAADFLCSLPEVDAKRLGCTGASGGGTQTFALAAVDDRVSVSAVVCMVSAYMQGGCLCENAPNLRIETSNVEIASLMAPRPMLLVSATGDWTKNTPHEEYPAIKRIYDLFQEGDRVHHVQFDCGHNYNRMTREAVYAWFGRWLLGDGDARHFAEEPFQVEKDEDLLIGRLWRGADSGFAGPSLALDREGLTRQLIEASTEQFNRNRPESPQSLEKFRGIYLPALRHALAVGTPDPSEVEAWRGDSFDGAGWSAQDLMIGRKGRGDLVPALLLLPAPAGEVAAGCMVTHPDGKAAVANPAKGYVSPLAKGLLEAGHAVLAIDCFLTGECPRERARHVSFFTTYNRTDTSERVQDILTAVAFLRKLPELARKGADLVGAGEAGLWSLLAFALDQELAGAAVSVAGFDSSEADDGALLKTMFVPGLRRAGDLRAAMVLAAPRPLLIQETKDAFRTDLAAEVYTISGARENLRVEGGELGSAALVEWISRLYR